MKRSTRGKNSARNQAGAISRREFAWRAATAAAAAAAIPGSLPLHAATPLPQESVPSHPKLPAESLAEADSRATEVLRRYGAKLSEEQKAEIRRLSRETQVQLEVLRHFPLENPDEPATVLQLVRTSAVRRSAAVPGGSKPKPGGEGS